VAEGGGGVGGADWGAFGQGVGYVADVVEAGGRVWVVRGGGNGESRLGGWKGVDSIHVAEGLKAGCTARGDGSLSGSDHGRLCMKGMSAFYFMPMELLYSRRGGLAVRKGILRKIMVMGNDSGDGKYTNVLARQSLESRHGSKYDR